MLPNEAHLLLCKCHVYSSTIGLVNVPCRIAAYVRNGIRNVWRTDCANETRVRGNTRMSERACVVLVIDGLGNFTYS